MGRLGTTSKPQGGSIWLPPFAVTGESERVGESVFERERKIHCQRM
jgi:hypothetical protein